MLKLVPIGFRQAARTRVTERAEMLAGEAGQILVNLDNAVRALAATTPVFQQSALVSALQQEGIDTLPYFQENLS
jgi:hypothetical protein